MDFPYTDEFPVTKECERVLDSLAYGVRHGAPLAFQAAKADYTAAIKAARSTVTNALEHWLRTWAVDRGVGVEIIRVRSCLEQTEEPNFGPVKVPDDTLLLTFRSKADAAKFKMFWQDEK